MCAEDVGGQGERRQVLRAVGEGAEPAMGRRRVQLEMDAPPALQVLPSFPSQDRVTSIYRSLSSSEIQFRLSATCLFGGIIIIKDHKHKTIVKDHL